MTTGSHRLTFVSCHAANMDGACQAILDVVASALELPIEFINDIEWQDRYRLLDAGAIDLAWICGAPYVRRRAQPAPTIELLAAPVWSGARYAGQPVYFADMIVRCDRPFATVADLRGASWVYNEPGSLSGFHALSHHLTTMGETSAFFGRTLESGGHLKSLQMVIDGAADVTAIDSTVLEQHLRLYPEQSRQIRLVHPIGPLPSMPWVASHRLPDALRQHLRHLLVGLAPEACTPPYGQPAPLRGFVEINDSDYDPVRTILGL